MLDLIHTTKRSFREQLILFGTGLPCIFLFPFSLSLFSTGDDIIGIIGFLITVGLLLICYQVWQKKKIKYINIFLMVGFMLGVLSVMYLRGVSVIFWAFPTLIFSYFVLTSRLALACNTLFIGGFTLVYFNSITQNQLLSIYPNLILVGFFGFVFSVCVEIQNKNLLGLVSIDPLTGLKNRRSFDAKTDEILTENRRLDSSRYLLLLDLDYLKSNNDIYDHKKGDQLLIDFSKIVKTIIRKTDYMYNIDNEEFAIITSASTLENVEKFADVIREKIQGTPHLSKYRLTVSIGVSKVSSSDTKYCWYKRTELALYQAKAKGGNRVWIATLDKQGEIHLSATKRHSLVPSVKVPPSRTVTKSTDQALVDKLHTEFNFQSKAREPLA